MGPTLGLTAPRPEQLRGWTPIRLGGTAAEPIVEWCHTEGESFEDPFFDQSVQRCLRRPFNLLFRHRTAMATVGEVAAGDCLPLAGLVFHCSRCGSTLVSQMLGRLASVLVMAEPAPLHSILAVGSGPDGANTDERRRQWLRWMVAALGRSRNPGERHLVVELDAWAVLSLPLILEAFPTTPWVFLYRDPVEVLASHLGHRGFHMIPGSLPPELIGLAPDEATRLAPEQYLARVLGALLKAAAKAAASPAAAPGTGRSRLVEYRQLPDAVADGIAPLFGIEVSPAEREDMAERAGRDAKNVFLPFAADGARKQQEATPHLRAAADEWVQPWYAALEILREAEIRREAETLRVGTP